MTLRARRRRWVEPDAAAPLDLRLALPAAAVWAGCLLVFWTREASRWIGAGAVLVSGVAAVVSHRRGARIRILVVLTLCAAAGLIGAGLQLIAAGRDPLMVAAARGAWVTVEIEVTGDPVPVTNPFAAGDDGAEDASRWRISARARTVNTSSADIRSRQPSGTSPHVHSPGTGAMTSRVTVTVFADGPAWADAIPRQVLSVSGSAGTDLFTSVPGATIRARGDPHVIAGPPWWASWAAPARGALARIAQVLDPDRGGLLRGLVVGDTRGMPQQLQDDAKTSGLAHLVAVSGSHMAIVAGMVLMLFRRFGPRLSSLVTVAAVAGMVILVGPEPSVVRSAVMGLLAAIGVLAGRARATIPVLAATVMVLLLWNPSLSVNVGFTLSVLATAALLLVAPLWIASLRRRGVPRGWATVIAVPVAAHLATVPVIASFSGAVSTVAVIANIAVTPIVAPALLIGLACLALAPWWPGAATALARVDGPLVGWIAGVAHRTSSWPIATIPWAPGPWGALALAGIVLAGLMVLRVGPLRAGLAAAAVGALVVIVPSRMVLPGWPADDWVITGCDVGQGDGMVLATGAPDTAVVVDTGTDPEPITSCLRDLGVTSVAMLVLTHLHEDHIGGAVGVLGAATVGMIGVHPGMAGDPVFTDIAAAAAARNVPVVELRPDQTWTVGELDLHVLGPLREFHGTDSDENNESVVIKSDYRGVRTLLTGDIELEAQMALLRSGADLRAEVLKQPHHGSARIMPEFVAAVAPQIAVIGVGVDNAYGHPSESALRADRAARVKVILRTDEGGDVQVTLTPDGLATVSRGRSGGPAP